MCQSACKKSCNYYISSHPPRQCPTYWKKCVDCSKINHFREVCRSRRSTSVHKIKQAPDQCEVEDAPLRCVAYALQKPFEEELEQLQKQEIIAPLGIDETAEWCNSFVLVLKASRKVRLCLDPARLNQALIRPMHRGPTLNDILPKLNNAQYLSLKDGSSGYHNMKLDKKSSYLTMFACQFGRYRYKRLTCWIAPAGDLFQRKIDKIFKDLPNVFGIAYDILVVGYEGDGKDQDQTLQKVLKTCKQVNLKLNKDKCNFRCTSVIFEISRHGVKLDPWMLKSPDSNATPDDKNRTQAFLVIINYLSRFSPSTASACKLLR